MKSLITIIAAIFINITAIAQTINTATSFDVGGIKVIFKPSQKKVINVGIYFRGGVTNFSKEKAGIEQFALRGAVECGTQNYTANALRDTSDKYDIYFSGASSFDYGFIQLNCISKYFDKGWDMFADIVMNPTFQAGEVQLLRNKIISDNKLMGSRPIVDVSKILLLNAYKGTSYGIDPYGTDATLNNITAADIKDYYNNVLLSKEKLFIVVVGNITKDELKEKILLSFGNIRSKQYDQPFYEAPVLSGNKIITQQKNIPSNYVSAMSNAPIVKSPDFIPFKLGVAALSATLYYNLTKAQLVNTINADCSTMQMPHMVISLVTNTPQQAIDEIVKTIKNLQRTGVNEEWLARLKNAFIITSFINQQSNLAVTENLALSEIDSNWQYADDFPQLVYMASVEQVNNALNTYITGLTWSFLGDTNSIKNYTIPLF
ncbi:pitrilysin family protein [Mucilaginibacter sp.]|uniref:M16 family metallopeptidase n=1 Tax=Mucilaginibacter sp. TaxID=1882438 RepID=UPI0026088624|nr:pitrilysin family protein [Mucilaginibacter sp.]